MEKLQWFKFSYADWRMGKIQRCSEITQARFINLCCLYWSKECNLTLEDAEIEIDKQYLDTLLKKKIIESDGEIIFIKFLDEQLVDITETSKGKSKAAKVRWDKYREEKEEKNINADAMRMHIGVMQNNAEKRREEEIREDKRKEDEIIKKEQYTHENKFCEDVIKYFNETCKDLANVGKLTPQRISLIEARNKEHGKNVIKNVIMSVNENDFYCGRQSNSDWKATFDWVFKASNFLKIKEADIVNKPNSFYGLSKASIQEKINYTMRRQG